MQVCDHCHRVPKGKDSTRVPEDIELVVIKNEMKGPKGGSKRKAPREIIKIQLNICDACLTEFNKKLGGFIRAMRMHEEPMVGDEPIGHTKSIDTLGNTFAESADIIRDVLEAEREVRERPKGADRAESIANETAGSLDQFKY